MKRFLFAGLALLLCGCAGGQKQPAQPTATQDATVSIQQTATPSASAPVVTPTATSSLDRAQAQEVADMLHSYGMTTNYAFPQMELGVRGGGTLNTADLKGKVVVVNLLATWCGYCEQELPLFASAMRQYDEDEVVFVFIDTGEDVDNAGVQKKLDAMMKDAGLANATVLLDRDGKMDAQVNKKRAYPCTLVIDPSGAVRVGVSGAFGNTDEISMMVDMVLHYKDMLY